ncbi:hypothetical protein [Butyrivibrio sp. AE2015]|uniref:hypothetical protein n=1 Tax=Butyrivibrio sp. AE2015 TaxID=1280663 RepID=UPI0003B46D1A|nr:hypothetical protein [Butyrivibrio sp. AE2015]
MLSKPDFGWSKFEICDEKSYSLSYLTDVACDWLEQAIHGLQTQAPFAVHGYCEPGRMVCLVSYYTCYVVFEADGGWGESKGYKDLYGVDLPMIDFCRVLYNDINENLEEWVHWDLHDLSDDDDDEEAEETRAMVIERRKLISDKLKQLKTLIQENEVWWTPHHGFF